VYTKLNIVSDLYAMTMIDVFPVHRTSHHLPL